MFGSASACSCAAMFGVSPMMPRSCAPPGVSHLTDDHEAGGNPDPRLQWRGCLQRSRCRHQIQSRANRALGIVLVRFRIAKIEYRSVPVRVGDLSVVPTSRFSDAAMIASDNLAYILRVHSGVLSAKQ